MDASKLLNEKPGIFDLRFRLFGTSVRVKPMFWIMMGVFGWFGTDPSQEFKTRMAMLGVWILAGFLSVLVHEFGHITAGRIFGYPGVIVLFMFGGGAIGEYLRARPWQRIIIALAGPAAGALLYALIFATATTWTAYVLPRAGSWQLIAFAFYRYMAFMGLLWTIFNLFPIMPQDGGMVVKDLIVIFLGKRFERLVYAVSLAFALGVIYYFVRSWQGVDMLDNQTVRQMLHDWTPPGYFVMNVRLDPTFAIIMYGILAFTNLLNLIRRERPADAESPDAESSDNEPDAVRTGQA